MSQERLKENPKPEKAIVCYLTLNGEISFLTSAF